MAIKKVNTRSEYSALVHSTGESDVTLITDINKVNYDGVNVEVSMPKPGDIILRDAEGDIHFIGKESYKESLLPSGWTFVEPYYYGWKDELLVDMGLPSGTLWGKYDIDLTKASKFCDTPMTYMKSFTSWGNTFMYNPNASNSFSGVYDWGSANSSEPYYEGKAYGSTPGAELTESFAADSGHDAARENLGGDWKMPTSTQFQELYSNCDCITADGEKVTAATSIAKTAADKRVNVYGINGLYLRSRTNGNMLFFACSGYGNGTSWLTRGSYGYYWSSSFGSARSARVLVFSSGVVNPSNTSTRYGGCAVRPVQ